MVVSIVPQTGSANREVGTLELSDDSQRTRQETNFSIEAQQKNPIAVGREERWSEYFARHEKLMKTLPNLKCSQISKKIYDAVNLGRVGLLEELRDFEEFTRENYSKTLRTFLYCEEAYQAVELRKFDRFEHMLEIIKQGSSERIGYTLPGVSERNPQLVPGDIVVLHNRQLGLTKEFEICRIDGDFIQIAGSFRMRDWELKKYDISFVSSGIPYARCHAALENCIDLGRAFFNIVFESNLSLNPTHLHAQDQSEIELTFDTDKFNKEQRDAIKAIVNRKFRPVPYILFGPPGTGKTSTLIEAVVQVYKTKRSSKILVCVNSNVCVDNIHNKILERNLDNLQMTRINAGDSMFDYKFSDSVRRANIIVTTNIKASCLSGRLDFDYIFIDEAGHANEAESLVPLSLIRSDCDYDYRSAVILAGDPKQLGPVIKMREIERLGLGRSLLERLFETKPYQKDPEKGYNSDFITKLVVSYRCDPRILAPSNKLFYENELKCPCETPKSILKMLNLDSPLVMHHVQGEEYKWRNSTSWANEEEAEACTDLVIRLYEMGFEPSQIGIITPYRSQMRQIRYILSKKIRIKRALLDNRFMTLEEEAAKNDDDLIEKMDKLKLDEKQIDSKKKDRRDAKINWMCEVNTVDAFQGSEKDIIIISTVRTNPGFGPSKQLGFLNDPRRFNVAISRARWLAVVVGNRYVLEEMSFWPDFLRLSKPLH